MSTETNDDHRRRIRFRLGDAVAIVEGPAVCVIQADPDSDLVRALVDAMQRSASVDDALEALVRTGGLDLPAFALAAVDQQAARIVVRGSAVAHLTTRDGHESMSAVKVGTWVEKVLDGVESILLAVDPSGSDAIGLSYEVENGLVPVDTLEISTAPATLPAPRAASPFAAPTFDGVGRIHGSPQHMSTTSVEASPFASDEGAAEPAPASRAEGESGAGDDASPPPPIVGPAALQVDGDVEFPRGTDSQGDVGPQPGGPTGTVAGHGDVIMFGDPARVDVGTFDAESKQLVESEQPESFAEVDSDVADGSVTTTESEVDASPAASAPAIPAQPAPPIAGGPPVVLDDRATLIGPFDPKAHSADEAEEALVTPPSDVVQSDSEEEAAGDDYDHLFGATRFRTVEQAAVRPVADVAEDAADSDPAAKSGVISGIPGAAAPTPDAGLPNQGDHDGYTVSLASLRAGLAAGSVASPSASAPSVHAVSCAAGHLNPTHADRCRVCGTAIHEQEHVSVPRPVLGTLAFSDGRSIEVSRPLLIGRSPKAARALSGDVPELVVVPSPQKEVSGTHLEIRIEGWQVLAVDLQSTNGTIVTAPGRDPQRLRPDEPTPIVPGTVVSLADETEFTFEASA